MVKPSQVPLTVVFTSAYASPIPKSLDLATVRLATPFPHGIFTDSPPAFILYRQHHQANVVAQNPGLANPEISKIIGEQWQNQPPEVKNKWKALAEEEKIRHQQQYPTYRYQPKRSGRRGSLSSDNAGEKPRCTKCGGRSILTPSTPYHGVSTNLSPASGPQTPSSVITPVSRTLPVLKDLSLQSPAARRMGKHFPGSNMSPAQHGQPDARDDLGPLSPETKRRRYNSDHAPPLQRVMPPRYGAAPLGHAVGPGPGTPFPFGQAPPHPYPPGAATSRRESLPGIRKVVSPPGAMGPPPRPGPGYQQHRLSQGHAAHDRSLTLPPLQTRNTGGAAGAVATAGAGKSAKEQIMALDFFYKVGLLRKVAPPTPVKKAAPRGPFVVIEGDNADAAKELATWLSDTLRKGEDLHVNHLDGPTLTAQGSKEMLMAQYHELVAAWLRKSADIRESLAIKASSPTDSVMVDAAPSSASKANSREIDENYDESDDPPSQAKDKQPHAESSKDGESERTNADAEKMDVDSGSKATGSGSSQETSTSNSGAKPLSVIANYSLRASNYFACRIPIDAHDPYAPSDHWQWTATQWRGIISPDLTIYVRDAADSDSSNGGKQSVDILDDGNLFVVTRTKGEGKEALEVEASTLRRLGFEVSEWVRAFGSKAD